MKGDFSRFTFKADRHHSGVLMQQGRVQLDADWNEQIAIGAHRSETEAIDVIGGCGAPMHAAGFRLADGPVPGIGKGRYYVDGILCENEAEIALDQQPDLPVAALGDLITPRSAAVPDGLYLAYLDVWQRHVTALEDEGIREVALGGPDTATRSRTIWQVKLLGPLPAPLTCVSQPEPWVKLLDRTKDGKLSAQAEESATAQGPCVVSPGAGYRRLENQLYRVEIHQVNASGAITQLKWSRDNGSIVTRWLDQKASEPGKLIVSSIGRDSVLCFGAGQHVEVVDDARELLGEAGILVKLVNAEGQVLTLDGADPNAATVLKAKFPDQIAGRPNNPKVRRWDGALSSPAVNTWLELEDGVQIRFEPGNYQVGDYWLIPARTATADVEWPRDDATPAKPVPQPRRGIEHHYCKLGILERTAGSFKFSDCRKLFPPLTELTTLLYESGDGQEAMPEELLPQPLSVRVVNGQQPVIGAAVRFIVEKGNGNLSVAQPVSTVAPDGIASCRLTLGNAQSGVQSVRAELIDAAGAAIRGQVLHFNANLSIANLLYAGGDGQEARPNQLLPQSLRVRAVNERGPLGERRVRFTVTEGGGNFAGPTEALITTDAATGMAESDWTLGNAGRQEVKAVLLDAANNPIPGQALYFNAQLNLNTLLYVGGDGQEAMPANPLPQTLRVRVVNGQAPVSGARVLFTVNTSGGSLSETAPVSTGNNGIAECSWTLGTAGAQEVEAVLLDTANNPVSGQVLRFGATLSLASQVSYDPARCSNLANAKTVQEAIDLLCKNTGGNEDGIRIEEVLLSSGATLFNDSFVPPAELGKGIRIGCDKELFQGSVQNAHGYPNPVCTVTLELPWPLLADEHKYWQVADMATVAFQPMTLAADVNADGNSIYWSPVSSTQQWLDRLLEILAKNTNNERKCVLARLKVMGNFIWGPEKKPSLYLDGEAFGEPGSKRVDVRLPSGNGRRGGNYEMWFWLGKK